MASSGAGVDVRLARLHKLFDDVLYGRRSLSTARDGKLFIEAICAQSDPPTCVHKLISSPNGLHSLQASMRFDISPQFLNSSGPLLLRYLREPSLETISSGSVLGQILVCMVEPPFFWDAFTTTFREGLLDQIASEAYAWLLSQLVRLPGAGSDKYVLLAGSSDILDPILKSSEGEVRILGQKIKQALTLKNSNLQTSTVIRPGGRHDNDFEDIRHINIMPTEDELLSKERPFLRTPEDYMDDPKLRSSRLAIHKDNQFRLLREDMLGGIREELQSLMSGKPGRHKGLIVDNLRLVGVDVGQERKRQPWGIMLQCKTELPYLTKIEPEKRQKFLRENPQILRNQNMACLLVDDQVVAFPSIQRNEDELAKIPANIVLQLHDNATANNALSKIKMAENIKIVQLDTAVFAYEPFLQRLQHVTDLPLTDELLDWEPSETMDGPTYEPKKIIQWIRNHSGEDLRDLLRTSKSVCLDESQTESTCTSLSQRVSLIQGPPGTGKSLTGAVIARVLHVYTSQVVLVICFTNHALDQFLEDLMDIGIPESDMVRLGGKSTDRTKPLMIREQTGSKLNPSQWDRINRLETRLQDHENRLREAFKRYQSVNPTKRHLMEYLEFLTDPLLFFDAFSVPTGIDGGMTRVGKRGKAMGPYYLLDRWIRGEPNAGSLQDMQLEGSAGIWSMELETRRSTQLRWQTAIVNDLVTEICSVGKDFNADQAELAQILKERDAGIIKGKRVIACTTNGAAKHFKAIQSTFPGVVLVEEAGEILEAHILTALGPKTEQLILIGDHQQLRPKCSYELSVDKGEGYDLNRSLFERLVLKGFPHITLTQQHRMRPEISSIVRKLTYPNLKDAASTLKRQNLRGFIDNVVFVNHVEMETEVQHSRELRDPASKTSKQNKFEAQMILKCVRYLAQQGYGSDKLVILTPYLGQLKLLRDTLAEENDPILNDLDKYDLVRAGLLTESTPKASKPSLRISTIDNYQGEESDIVLASLTRSNNIHDIGFMAEPERMNVLFSRARNAMILIGNAQTFIHARKGKEVWKKFFDHLTENGHVYAGFPVKCEKHPNRAQTIHSPDDFEMHCPDGGCDESCGIVLKCGVHRCPSKCHQLIDHSKMKCMILLKKSCGKGHSQSWACHSGAAPATCQKCERETKDAEKKTQKALEEQQRVDAATQKHLKEIAKVQAEIDQTHQSIKDARVNSEQATALQQKKLDLAALKELASKVSVKSQPEAIKMDSTNVGSQEKATAKQTEILEGSNSAQQSKDTLQKHIKICLQHKSSNSKTEWQRQKDIENASSPAIDAIMDMIGLETVKSQILKIKARVDLSIRQGTDLKKERHGLVLLGNPGTGKTTVARHYAKVLTSLHVLPGDGFVETTGSRLAHGGVTEVKSHLATLENSNGGVYFIDEAYQLAEGHNYGGKTVLDFLLAEIENLVGKVVFVFAGYRKQMEKFFEHNPGFASRIPYTLNFEDYADDELLQMLQYKMDQYYHGSIKIDGGPDGLYMRIVVRRLGRGRGRDGFGNARAVENLFSQVRERQADRLGKERRDGLCPDDNTITREDLIGPDPSKAILKCDAWNKLQGLTGLKSVKNSVRSMIDRVKTNYEREIQEAKLVEVSLNRIFLGSPGTGKTTVAKLYGQILADIGLLSNGEVVVKNPADFIGNVMGDSEARTKAILETTVGKVLIIDEAYMLYSGGVGNSTDVYRTAVIDTLVAEIQSVPGEDRCVLLLGYENQMVEMFQNVNPGLTRRFQLSESFRFEDFDDAELEEILRSKLKSQDLGATENAISVAIECLARARNGLNFGNGGDVQNLISKANNSFQLRQAELPPHERPIAIVFEPHDFDPNFDRASSAETNLQELFKDVVGCEPIIEKLEGYIKVARGMRAQNRDPRGQIPMNFIFKGPPGTGKTTTARKFGQVFHNLGFLSQADVVECSATDLIGQYVGQTGPKTIKQLERGLGKVLFIDEAYRLAEGLFAQEAVNELVDTMTKPRFVGKLVIILAGYDNDMNNLMRVNEGLSSRFADEIIFAALNPEHSISLLKDRLKEERINFPDLDDPENYQVLYQAIWELTGLPSWGNARDIQTLTKSMVRAVYQSIDAPTDPLEISYEIAISCLNDMIKERRHRVNTIPKSQLTSSEHAQVQSQSLTMPPPQTQISKSTASRIEARMKQNLEELSHHSLSEQPQKEIRDDGVSDAIWSQLQRDKRTAELEAERHEQQLKEAEKIMRAAEEAEKEAVSAAAAIALREKQAKDEAEARELLRKLEEARIREMKAKADRERMRQELEKRQLEILERKRKEEQAQARLRQMGVCEAGFRWIKQSGGYRCEAGGHYVSNGQLGI